MKSSRAAKRTKHEETGVKSCDFDVFLSEENSLYTKEEIRNRKSRGEYVPTDKANAWQIRKAAKEYWRRGLKLPGYELRSPFVKVAENVASIPPWERIPSHFNVKVGGVVLEVKRIVFFLHNGDLFIVKITSGTTQPQAVTLFHMQVNDYYDARGKVLKFVQIVSIWEIPGKNTRGNKRGFGFAPDFGINSKYPKRRDGIPLLRGVFIAEVEVFHQDERALISRLSKYATIPQNKYLCGIKIYKDYGTRVHRAAIGVVWKRNGAKYEAIKIMNFGRESATPEDIDKWTGIESTTLGPLPSRIHSANRWLHQPAVDVDDTDPDYIRTESNGAVTLSVPDADLVEGVVDRAGQRVVPDPNLSFDIDFGRFLSASDFQVDRVWT